MTLRLHISDHNDDLHNTTAKRNLAGGVAGLNASDEVTKRLSYEDVASGIPTINTDKKLSSEYLPFYYDHYCNHNGDVDNFVETNTTGNGTATEDAANHEMDLVSAGGAQGYAVYQVKSTYTLNTKELICHFLVQNINESDGNGRNIYIGLADDFHGGGPPHRAVFYWDGTNWMAICKNGGVFATWTMLSPIVNGDWLTVIATSSLLKWYVNGGLVASKTTRIPTGALHPGIAIDRRVTSGTINLAISADYIEYKRDF